MYRFNVILPMVILFSIDAAMTCKWVCVDKHNNIKQYYFDQTKFNLEFHQHEIAIPTSNKNQKTNDKKGRKSAETGLPIPEVTLRMPEYEVLPLQVNCNSKDFSKKVKEIAKKIKCKPRDTIVDIKYKGAKQITPHRISTKLCSGVCSGTRTCVSLASKNVTIAVSILDAHDQAQCSHVQVPEDTKCKCGCDKKETECLPSQVFDKKFCKCKCVNDKELRECLTKINNSYDKYEWNKNTCSCNCKRESVCSTGSYWSKADCKCTRKLK